MRALQVTELIGPEGLKAADVPEPVGGESVLIDVEVAGVTYPDLLLTRGLYQLRPETPFTPGLEVAGRVRSAPPDSGLAPGDRIVAYTGVGGFAEQVAVPSHQVASLRDSISFAEGAALVVNFHAVYYGLVERARLGSGDTLLVYGASGALGTAAIQIGAALGMRLTAVVSAENKAFEASSFGADRVIYEEEAGEAVAALGGVDAIFDPIGVATDSTLLKLLRPEGRLLVMGFASGDIPQIPANRLLLGNLDAVGVGWGHILATRPRLFRSVSDLLQGMVEGGEFRPFVRKSLPLEQGQEALRAMDERRSNGKFVLEVVPQDG